MSNPWDSDPIIGGKTSSPQEFAQVYGPVAKRISEKIGVDQNIILGQLGLETGWGKSIIPGTNNLGNIKDFAGGGVGATDNMTGSKDKYRAYATPEDFADDFASLIQRKYPNAMNAGADSTKFTSGLKGYAEDPRYSDKVAAASQIVSAKQNPVMKAVGGAVNAVMPSANAATGNPWDNDPVVETVAPAARPPEDKPSSLGEKAYKGALKLMPGGAVLSMLSSGDPLKDAGNTVAGAVRGAGSIGTTALSGVRAGLNAAGIENSMVPDAERRAAMNDALTSMGADTNSGMFQLGKVGTEIAGTLGVGGAVAAPIRAAGLPGVAQAVSTAGAQGPNMLARMIGGGINGAASAGLIDPNTAGTGAALGTALPPLAKFAGAVGNAAGGLVRPFTAGGQDRIVGNALRDFATDPVAARQALAASREIIPGSAPIAATAAGDDGIAALSRSMQNADPAYAAQLSARQTAQNQARTGALEGIAGNTGKIDVAKAARDAATGPMREQALNAAGKVPSSGIVGQIDNMLADPNNAGQLSQQALTQFKGRIEQFTKDGAIDARALYAIRKDINDALGGKLQGDAGNIKYAAGQLKGVKGLIDDAIDQASKAVPANAIGQGGSAPNWKGYLQKYADESIPIKQMERLDEVLKSIQTGTVDSQGGMVLSAAKLNNVLKNKGADLGKELSPAQLDVLRRVQADLNAGQIANNTGRAVGSNTVQNLAQNQLMQSALGKTIGNSTAANSTLGRLLQLPYGTANKQIQERLGNALLNPQEAARLLADPKNNALLQALTSAGYRAAPALAAR